MPESKEFKCPPGMVALTSHGSIRVETAFSLLEASRTCEKAGAVVAFAGFSSSLVDKGRNDACRVMLSAGHQYVLFIDGDMVFKPDAILRLLKTAYQTDPWADVVGGYCCLRGGAVPTIDTGTGTWESHYPGSGVMEVIRTGAAFVLVKRHVIEKMPYPWYGIRSPMRWVEALLEVDNLARVTLNGTNPFRALPAWEQLQQKASNDPQSRQAVAGYEVGEDSGFCDRAKSMGFRIAVDSDVEIGHMDLLVLDGTEHKKRMEEREREARLLHGALV